MEWPFAMRILSSNVKSLLGSSAALPQPISAVSQPISAVSQPTAAVPQPIAEVPQHPVEAAPQPIEPLPMLRLAQVLHLLPVSKSTFYQGIADGRFPAPLKNGKISLWRWEDIAKLLGDPTNLRQFPISRRLPRNLARSEVFKDREKDISLAATALEKCVLFLLLHEFDRFCETHPPNDYDRACAENVRERIAELEAGGSPSWRMLQQWKPGSSEGRRS